jgi:hypothetical protein
MIIEEEKELAALGFKSYSTYLASPLWKLIHREVTRRDAYQCRVKGCTSHIREGQTKRAWHLSYSKGTLLGLGLGQIVTICNTHQQAIEFDASGQNRPLVKAMRKALELVIGTKFVSGVSNPKIGRWFHDQRQVNKPIVIRLLGSLREESPNGTK